MLAAKAHAGGFGGALSVIVIYFLQQVPLIAAMPEGPATALDIVISTLVVWAIVYFAPANTEAS